MVGLVADPHPFAGRLNDAPVALLALPQRLLGESPGADVDVNAAHLQRPSVFGSLDYAASVEHPHPMAVLVAHAILGLARAWQSFKLSAQSLGRDLQIVRVHLSVPARLIQGHLTGRIAEHLVIALIRYDLARLYVPLVAAQLGTGECEFQAFGHRPRLFLGAAFPSDVHTGGDDADHLAVLVL